MEFYTYQFFINQSSNTNLMKYLVFISLLALLLIIILKKFHSRDKMKYRDLIILVSLGIIFMVGIQINEYEGLIF
jgi:membrane-associated HD superfamily phosphohydrolase